MRYIALDEYKRLCAQERIKPCRRDDCPEPDTLHGTIYLLAYTIAFDGEIGYFSTYRTKQEAELEAAKWRLLYPQHIYEVTEEDPEEVEYQISRGTLRRLDRNRRNR